MLREPRMRCELTDEELQSHAQQLVERLPDNGDFRASDLTNLALSEYTQSCIEHAPQLVKTAAPDAGLDHVQAKQAYRETLARSVTAVFERQSEIFKGMVDAVQGATSVSESRDVAWERHSAWVRGLFHEAPIFSPDSDIDIPLSSVYQKLRCYWNTEHEKEQPDDRDPLKYRTATVAELHDSVDAWIEQPSPQDALRLIAGGPGSGKSSFAKAYSAERINKNTHRVLFIQLQNLTMFGTLKESIGRHLVGRHGYKWPNKTEGFPENPLDWHGEDTRPILLVFDGLDELTTNTDRENDLTTKFVSNLKHVLNDLNAAGHPAAAIVLGRDLAMDSAREDGDLSLDALLHVAPIRAMVRDDLRLERSPSDEIISDEFDPVVDDHNLMERDTRIAYWKKWCKVQGIPDQDPSPAITDERMSELNVEPLLLHLLIISDFCGDRWEEAAKNRNLVYRDILQKVFRRNRDRELDAYRRLNEEHFFELMEVFGLAAFRGNGRTGDHEEFKVLRKRYANPKAERTLYSELDGASLKNVALMVHSRQDIDGAGFEFVHKSFGEYLAARALLGSAERLQKLWNSEENDEGERQLALRWVDLIGGGEISKPVLQFLRDECKLRGRETNAKAIETLSALFDWSLENGFPVQESIDLRNLGFRALEHRQKCAEAAMLVTVTSLWAARDASDASKQAELLPIKTFAQSHQTASAMIDRLFRPGEMNSSIPAVLSGLILARSNLYMCRISGADLNGANMRGADLRKADLMEAHLSEADLSGAYLVEAHLRKANLKKSVLGGANLVQADLRQGDFSGADLSDAHLMQADLRGVNLREADLSGADLRKADLHEADLSEANLTGADLSGAYLMRANLTQADLSGVHLVEADLRMVDLSRANLTRAYLMQADLRRADLSGANLTGADLSKTDLSGANLTGAQLSDCRMDFASLRSVDCTRIFNLSQQQVNAAFGVKSGVGLTILPFHLSCPDHWYIAEDKDKDSREDVDSYLQAWRAWQNAQRSNSAS